MIRIDEKEYEQLIKAKVFYDYMGDIFKSNNRSLHIDEGLVKALYGENFLTHDEEPEVIFDSGEIIN